jgi:hypothetical protein
MEPVAQHRPNHAARKGFSEMLFAWHLGIARSNGGPEVGFGVHVRNDNRDRTPPLVRLKAVCGPGDDAEPVVTIMILDED